MRRALLVLVSVGLVVGSTSGCAPPKLTPVVVASGLDHPWDIGFLPDGTMLVTERPGRLSRVTDQGVVTVAAPQDVVAVGEAGMMGLAVDPFFAQNRFVFVCMSSRASVVRDVRIVRFQLTADGSRVLGRSDIVTGIPLHPEGMHAGCRPRFGPDNQLWIGTGDAATGTNPQDVTSLGGKVLRVTRTDQPAPGNPFGRLWFTRGHRNVQGLAFRPTDGVGFSIEHGTDRDDEINSPQFGGNYGWDPTPGYDQTRPMTDLERHPDAILPAWSSGDHTIAPSGATFLTGERWGTWDGALAVATLKGRHLHVFAVDGHGSVGTEYHALKDAFGRLRSAVQGPDGNLYLSTDNGDNSDVVVRITPSVVSSS